jgi:hypothetical protein
VDGTMDSSFLTWLNVGLALYSGISFFKMLIQFGLPNHPARFTCYLIALCSVSYFGFQAAVDLHWFSPVVWMKWRTLPLVAGGLSLLLQVIMLIGQFSFIQQKVLSRMPVIAGLLCFAFFPDKAEIFLAFTLVLGSAFLSISVGKARLQKRLYLKMALFMLLFFLFKISGIFIVYLVGTGFLFFALFYFFLFEQSIAINSMIDDFKLSLEGDKK